MTAEVGRVYRFAGWLYIAVSPRLLVTFWGNDYVHWTDWHHVHFIDVQPTVAEPTFAELREELGVDRARFDAVVEPLVRRNNR